MFHARSPFAFLFVSLISRFIFHHHLIRGAIFEETRAPHVWITVSSLVERNPNNQNRALLFRQIELNWINAPTGETAADSAYLALYLDNQPDARSLPVWVHKLQGHAQGQIISDHYLPVIDFYNETTTSLTTTRSSQHNEARSLLYKNNNNYILKDECVGYCVALHSNRRILARNCLKTNPNWMSENMNLVRGRQLAWLMIPGTHNSGTYSHQLDKSALQMINKYQLNQDETIFNQLVYGIRYLDLRVGWSKVKNRQEKLWIYHDIFRTDVSINEVLDQVRRFLDLTSQEIVIMDFHRFTVGFENEDPRLGKERHEQLIELIFAKLGIYIIPYSMLQQAPINEYVDYGKRLVIGYAQREKLIDLGSPWTAAKMIALNATANTKNNTFLSKPHDNDHSNSVPQQTQSPLRTRLQANPAETRQRVGTRIFEKLKTLKLVRESFSKRTTPGRLPATQTADYSNDNDELNNMMIQYDAMPSSLSSRVVQFCPQVKHLWPNRDTLDGLESYLNETACRRNLGELNSLMVELTPTVFGVISDKYDGNRRLAQLVNRHVTNWIRDRWLHCVNIIASDFFLGNDLIQLAIDSNKMRATHERPTANSYGQCRSFRKIGHLLDNNKIPVQLLTYNNNNLDERFKFRTNDNDNNTILHTDNDGKQHRLRPLTTGYNYHHRDRRGDVSFVDNVSDGISNLFSSFKRLLNL